ncbi:DUF932 domain-containing protein [Nocardia sp. NPDC004582]
MAQVTRLGRKIVSLRENRPLTDAEIMRVAPSIFATEAHQSRSDRYTHIPTSAVLTNLRGEGFEPFFVAQSVTRDEDRRGHAKHMLRLRHRSTVATQGAANEVVLVNSHDGASSYQMLAGLLEFVCTNGMVVGKRIEQVRVRHSGKVVDDVLEGAFTVVESFDEVQELRREMLALPMSAPEEQLFAQVALGMRYDPEENPAPIAARQLLGARRAADRDANLWKTVNRVQENLIRGGVHGETAKGRKTKTRAVTGLDADVKLNRALWTLAEGMKALKNGGTLEEFLAAAQ